MCYKLVKSISEESGIKNPTKSYSRPAKSVSENSEVKESQKVDSKCCMARKLRAVTVSARLVDSPAAPYIHLVEPITESVWCFLVLVFFLEFGVLI